MLGGLFPTMQIPIDEWAVLEDFVEDGQEDLELKAVEHSKQVEKMTEAQMDCRHFITVTRRTGFRRLHLNGCFVHPENCREVRHLDEVEQDDFDSICKTCRRKMASKQRLLTPRSPLHLLHRCKLRMWCKNWSDVWLD